jgi:predicted ATPase
MILQALQADRPDSFRRIVDELKTFHSGVVDIAVKTSANRLMTFLREEGLDAIVPSTRMSDGTLRYLCLLTILCHPDPPPLICIEEPEIGLHPDILPDVARLLVEASGRTQLIVTTHSDVLVSALSNEPESVLVFGRDASGTHVQRVELWKVQSLLADHTLGELWRMGEIGGNRW